MSLLGQYSDDDLDDESSEMVNHTVVDAPPTDFDNQATVAADKVCEQNTVINSSTYHDSPDIGQHNLQNGTASTEILHELRESTTTQNDASDANKDLVEQHISINETPNVQVNGDVCLGWKMVLHEESNQYYYWNTLTGETSWNVPDVLAELTSEIKNNNDAKGTENAVVGIHESNSPPGVNPEVSVDKQPTVGTSFTDENCKTEEMPNLSSHMEVSTDDLSAMPKDSSAVHDVKYMDKGYPDAVCTLHQEPASPEKLEAAAGAGSGKHTQNLVVPGEHVSGTDLCSHLLRLGEFLLERLDTLKGSKGRLIGHDKLSKYTVEVETRLSDIKSLSTHASSLLPFWLHCEKKFKQLESAISDEVLQFYESVELNTLEDNENNAVHSEEANTSHDAFVAEVLKEQHGEADNSVTVKNNVHTSNVHVNSPSDSNPEGKCEVQEAAVPDVLTPMAMVHSEEDIDMDVEMELEDVVPASATTYPALVQQPVWPNHAAEHEGAGIPPPPEDDWIPPPPLDDEPFPPPPPDNEPAPPPPPEVLPETSYSVPLPDPTTEPSFSYATQYNIQYPGSSIDYYGQSNVGVQENNYYAPDPNQLSVPLPSYYEALPNAYPATSAAVVNLGEHGSYYGLQDETAPPVPGFSGVQSSVLYFAASQGCLDSDQIGSNHITATTNGADVSTVDTEPDKKSVQDSLAPVSDQATAIISVPQVSSMSSVPAVPVAVASAVPKVHTKVSKNKKRGTTVVSTLKSNKKVSSLVDKWKAAKEELHEEDDEPENAYEMLEKKRQREIEEWRAQQIASGEAKDNANFQPLGGDWRERVKRKRARLMKKSVEDLAENITNGNQQPDLDKLQKDLPSGWQVYWDDASKQVYYGNSVTSETTWIRPS